MYEYEFQYSANMAKVLKPIAEVCDAVNASMASFGFTEKMTLRGSLMSARLSGVRRLTVAERDHAATTILSALQAKFPEYEIAYDYSREIHAISHP